MIVDAMDWDALPFISPDKALSSPDHLASDAVARFTKMLLKDDCFSDKSEVPQ